MPELAEEKLRPPPAPPEEAFAPSDIPYAELDVTTNFSFLHGASHPDELVLQAARLGYRAIAVTDINTLAGAVRMYDAARQIEQKTGWAPKLIIGTRLRMNDVPDLLVWATDRASYARLCRLLTRGRMNAPKGECKLALADFLEFNDGLLAGVVPPDGSLESMEPALPTLRDALGDRLSLVISRVYGTDDRTRSQQLLAQSRRFGIPLVATNAVHYHDPARRPLQDVLTCVRHQCTIHDAGFRLFPNAERYLKTSQQMHRLFANLPRAIERSLQIAERCTFSLKELRYEYPDEIVPAGKSAIDYLTELTWDGAAHRYPPANVGARPASPSSRNTPGDAGVAPTPDISGVPEKVRDLIIKELNFIAKLKYEAYFLTVYDVVKFARSRDILCQGRGSAANSTVCYCLGVTSVDPARINVLFERFLSAARGEPPDIDIDFEHERREEVIQYIYNKYGRERAGMTATVITYRGRSAVRDVGKALGLGLDVVDQLAKRLDWWHRGTLTDEQIGESGVDPRDPTVRALIALTAQLLGFPRHLSQHTGGMVMTRAPLCEMVPIENAAMEDRTVVEWDKDDIDTVGMLKVDVLALGMLTVISKGFKLIENARCAEERCVAAAAKPLDLSSVPDGDRDVYDMICDADTIGVFQIESRAQMSMLPRLRPEKFYDLVIEVAIVRPGPIQGNMVHPYLQRRELVREGRGHEIVYESDELRDTLAHTLGVPLFQEQAMRVVMVAAGFSAEEADRLRRAMAAWRKNGAINQFYPKIINGMLDRGYTREYAERVFEQIQGFGEYGFPESHAASFALLVYVSAWIKRHHPAVFCAALLNSQPMGFYAPAQIVIDARNHGVEVFPVDVNASEWDCTLEESSFSRCGHAAPCEERCVAAAAKPEDQKSTWGLNGPAMRLGFRRIKGMSEKYANLLIDLRNHCGKFSSIEQMHRLTDLPVSAMRRLAEADAFTSLGLSRREALWQVMALTDEELPLFEQDDVDSSFIIHHSSFLPAMPIGQEVMLDYETSGLSLKKHPLELIRHELDARRIITAKQLNDPNCKGWVRVAGLVLIRQRPGTASGIVFETLEDETGVVNLIVRPDIYEKYRPAARHAGLLECHGYVERQGKVVHIMAKRMYDLSSLLVGYQLSSRDFH